MKKIILSVIVGFIFFGVGLLTIHDYGISWDEPEHLRRGQAYLWYYFTGKLDYNGITSYNLREAQTNPSYHDRSFYQQFQFYNNKNPVVEDRGHPPLGDITSATLNTIFYQKLGLLGDIESYHLFQIISSSILVGMIFWIAACEFGILAGFFASLFLATYPLFFAESHFNIKDPAETTFFTLTVYLFWKGITSKKSVLIILSAIFAGVALGIKFNIFFAMLILTLWLFVYYWKNKKEIIHTFLSKKIALSLIFFLPIMFLIFFIFWPYLWSDPISHTLQSFKYYEKVGSGANYQSSYLVGSFNLYPLQWIIFTTPPVLLLFFIFGLFASIKLWTNNWKILSLILIWFTIPILRVSLSGFSIYGGVRQIMEYIPTLALIGGIGANWLIQDVLKTDKKLKLITASILLLVVGYLLILPLIKFHPYQNTYFNFLTGGLSGAIAKGTSSAGNSLGNVYVEGLEWVNKNASSGAKLTLIQGTTSNLPLFKIRPDINYSNYHFSGVQRGGEYIMEMTYNYDVGAYHYAWEYVDKLLDPVYEVKVDGAPLLKIWKNDLAHTKEEFRTEEKTYSRPITQNIIGNILEISLDSAVVLSRLQLNYSSTKDCQNLKLAYIETSKDGQNWQREKDAIPTDQVGRKINFDANHFVFYFAGRSSKYLRVVADNENACILKDPVAKLTVL
ncbi:MAG: glycosyltransferase family 39 protein [Candidatus Daviesbacteria bacterium]|nr:MAG: glycosyltransferase family 39 protein [Candidatus Daviesbacteria bacterium]